MIIVVGGIKLYKVSFYFNGSEPWINMRFIGFLCCICSLALVSCKDAANTETNRDDEKLTGKSSAGIRVKTVVAELRPFNYFIESNGKIQSVSERPVAAEASGRLVVFNGKPNVYFPKNAIIGRIDDFPIAHKLSKARLSLFSARKEFENQLLEYANLFNNLTAKQADSVRLKLKVASGLSAIEHDIEELQYELSKLVIVAPFDCILSNIEVEAGELVKPGQELFTAFNPNEFIVDVKILEEELSHLKGNVTAEVQPLALPGQQYKAKIGYVNPSVEESGLIKVRLNIVNAAPHNTKLFPGMNCMVKIRAPLSNCMIVPKDAIVIRSGKSVVFTVKKGRAKWNYVETGDENGEVVVIRSGIKVGDRVICSNNLQLAEDSPVIENISEK